MGDGRCQRLWRRGCGEEWRTVCKGARAVARPEQAVLLHSGAAAEVTVPHTGRGDTHLLSQPTG